MEHKATHAARPYTVSARKIMAIIGAMSGGSIMLQLDDGTSYPVDSAMTSRHFPVAGDYLVIGEDGYAYLNPAAVFERKFRPMLPDDAPSVKQPQPPVDNAHVAPGAEQFTDADVASAGTAVREKLTVAHIATLNRAIVDWLGTCDSARDGKHPSEREACGNVMEDFMRFLLKPAGDHG